MEISALRSQLGVPIAPVTERLWKINAENVIDLHPELIELMRPDFGFHGSSIEINMKFHHILLFPHKFYSNVSILRIPLFKDGYRHFDKTILTIYSTTVKLDSTDCEIYDYALNHATDIRVTGISGCIYKSKTRASGIQDLHISAKTNLISLRKNDDYQRF